MLRGALGVALLVAVLAGGVYAYDRWLSDEDNVEARPLVTAPVERRTLRQTVVTRGTVARGFICGGRSGWTRPTRRQQQHNQQQTCQNSLKTTTRHCQLLLHIKQ